MKFQVIFKLRRLLKGHYITDDKMFVYRLKAFKIGSKRIFRASIFFNLFNFLCY